MTSRATPNLPTRDFAATATFYEPLGFRVAYRSDDWMILDRGDVTLEFFSFADLDPATSSFSCCLRLDDADAFLDGCRAAGIPETCIGWPRLHPLRREDWGGRVGALVDPDGTLLRVIDNASL